MDQGGRKPFFTGRRDMVSSGRNDQGSSLHMKRLKLLPAAISALSLSLVLAAVPNSVIAAPGDVIYRINAGGAQLSGTPVWQADTPQNPSPYVSSGTKIWSTSNAIDMSHPSIPSGTPSALFAKHRYDPVAAPEMKWTFPVSSGTYEVRLFFAESFNGAQAVGKRVFDVSIEGATVLDDYDVYVDAGADKAVMKSFVVSSDSDLEIDFKPAVQNPIINGIEIRSSVEQTSALEAAPGAVAFPKTQVGRTSVQTVSLTNLGDAGDPGILIDATTLSGANAGQFSDGFDDAGSINLGPGQSTAVNVTFAPTSTGQKAATLLVAHSGENSPLNISLDGEGEAAASPPPSQATRVTPAPVMPLGDSITHGTQVAGGYRVKLEDHLIAAKRDFTFVGTQSSGDINLESRRHEGHKGYRIEDMANEVESWLGTQTPDHILLTIGTNDILQNNQLATAPARLSALIDQITMSRPSSNLVVSSLPPLSDPSLDAKVQQFNSAIPAIVEGKVNQGKSVSFVDMYSALTTADLRDGIHPNAVGYARMAERWRDALVPLVPERPSPPQVVCPCSLWPASNAAGNMSSVTTAREVGLKFRTDLPGHITGIRFFKKGPENQGPHVAHLWSLDGTLLGEATFGNETTSGWQQVNFTNPIAVTADTTYVASYFAPFGRFTAKALYFDEQMEVNYPLRALAWGMSTANGVYRSGSSGFPTTGSQANFWVDVIFQPN
jgi:lysophospholipase L1-like esterase